MNTRVSDALWALQNLPSDRTERDSVIDECHAVYTETRDGELLELLAKTLLPFAEGLARRRYYPNVEVDELISVASLGLTKALKAFDPSLGKFTSFARITINFDIKRYIRDVVPAVHAPRAIKELIGRISGARWDLEAELQREPTLAEIAEKLEVEPEMLEEAERAKQAYAVFRLDRLMEDSTEHLNIGRKDRNLERVEDRCELAPLFARLPHQDREVVYLRVVEGLEQVEIGRITGLTRGQVSRRLSYALETMRAAS